MPLKKHEARIEFHFRQKSLPLVHKIIGILEKEGVELFDYFSYRPSSTIHIIFEEDWTRSNGSASVFPENRIRIVTFPSLDSSFLSGKDDPIKNLVIHELAHIVHLDQAKGINRLLGHVFGSAGKLMPTVVPRWFSEGLATWAETRFTQGGRLRSAGVIWQVERSLLDPRFCSHISCLDSPGTFPYGSNSYWMGADFLAWVEEKKEDSILCLVRENADNLAFFLNHAFVDCTGKSANKLFAQYRRERRAEIRHRQKKLRKNDFIKDLLTPLEIHHFGVMDLERGAAISEGKLYYLWHHPEGGERLGIWDLEKKTGQSRRTPFFISSFLTPSGRALPVAVENNHLSRHYRRIVDLKSNQTLFHQSIGADYAFEMEDEKWLYFHWKGERWVIGEHDRQSNRGRILYQLPPWVLIKRPRLFQREGHFWVSFQVFAMNRPQPYQLWSWRVGDNKPHVLIQKSNAFAYWDQCEGVHLLKNSSNTLELIERNYLDQIVSKRINVEWVNQISFIVWDGEHTVVFLRDEPERAWHFAKGCGEIVAELSREVHEKSVARISDKSPKSIVGVQGKIKNYSAWRYMGPSWWLLGTRYESSQLYTKLETSLEDPKRFHQIDLKWETPFQKKEFDFGGSYSYRFSDFRETYIRIGYRHFQREGAWRRQFQSTTFSLYENFYLSNVTWTPILSLSEEKEGAHIQKVALSQRLIYRSARSDAFFYQGVGSVRLSRSWGEHRLSYTGGGAGLKVHIQPLDRFFVGWEAQYDKLFKNSLRGEILYGGGTNTVHSFYGLNGQDAWGNEMLTARGYLNGELLRIYSSWGLIPFYIKKIHWLTGIDYIKTDTIWLSRDKTYTRNPLHSHYWGVRLKFDLFYKNPGSWDVIQANLRNPLGGKDVRWVSSINISL